MVDPTELALDVEDFYPRTDFFAKDTGSLADDYAAGHFEASGRAVGRLTLDGEGYLASVQGPGETTATSAEPA